MSLTNAAACPLLYPFSHEQVDAGCNFHRQTDAATCIEEIFARLAPTNDHIIIASANGSFIDNAERAGLQRDCPAATVYAPGLVRGERRRE